jgi:uncharacterized protein DUF6894
MSRYYFYLTNGIRTVIDADGLQLKDEEAMRLETKEMIADLKKEAKITGADWDGWRVLVRDENGFECCKIDF